MIAFKNVLVVSCGVLLWGNASHAFAQEAIDPVPLRKKTFSTDPYAPVGIDAGGLRLFPSLEIGTVYTSNVAATASNQKSDIGIKIKPTLRFESDWVRHKWTGSATGDFLHYSKQANLSTLSGSVETAYRLDIRHTTHVDFSATYGLSTSATSATALGPRRDHSFSTAAGVTHDFGGLEGSVKLTLARGIFEDLKLVGGGTEDNSDRNYWTPSISLRASLAEQGAPLRPFAELVYQPRFHDKTIDRNGLKRDSQGFAANAGITFGRGPIWDGEIALTYLLRSYADASLQTTHALGATGRVTWRPTTITSVEATSAVSLDETATVGISATKSWSGGVNLTHNLRENLDAKAGLGLTVQDTGLATTLSTTAKLGLEWQVNPVMSVGIGYQGLWFSSTAPNGNYDDQRVMTSIVLKR